MAFISVTRLRPRAVRFLPIIAFHTLRSRRQLKSAQGFIGGYLGSGPKLALWTVTVWTDETSMRTYRNTAEHLKAMPQLIRFCDEASVVHWSSRDAAIPPPADIAERMSGGRTSKLRHPSAAHAAGDPWPDRNIPFKGPHLKP
jgi:hypothetical protein